MKLPLNLRIKTNIWGWTPRGVLQWMRGWGSNTWGCEISGSTPRTYQRRMSVGPVCFDAGTFPDGASPSLRSAFRRLVDRAVEQSGDEWQKAANHDSWSGREQAGPGLTGLFADKDELAKQTKSKIFAGAAELLDLAELERVEEWRRLDELENEMLDERGGDKP